jgi:hypothetical protein
MIQEIFSIKKRDEMERMKGEFYQKVYRRREGILKCSLCHRVKMAMLASFFSLRFVVL